jgi:hypothetical protein
MLRAAARGGCSKAQGAHASQILVQMQTKTKTGKVEPACSADSGIWRLSDGKRQGRTAPPRPTWTGLSLRNAAEWCAVGLVLVGLMLVGTWLLETITSQLLDLAHAGAQPAPLSEE